MDRTERFYKIQRLLTERRVVPRDVFLENLSVSRATFKRDLEYLRDRIRMRTPTSCQVCGSVQRKFTRC